MPGGSTVQRGNAIFEQQIAITITPPATITTAVITQQTYTVPGLNVGDLISFNQTTFASTLVSIPNMYVSAANTLTISFSTEGATVSGAAAISFLLGVLRPENYSLNGLTSLPNGIY